MLAIITVGIPPEIHLGPLTIAWHGLTIALGIIVGGWAASYWLRERGLPTDPVTTLGALLTVGALVGSRVFYLAEHDPAGIINPATLLSTRGFTFDGGLILATALVAGYVYRTKISARYLDAIAAALPLGIAIGRIGDVINGEHYGDRSTFFLAVRNSHPDALTPDPRFAYQSGGLYEVLLALLILAVVWPLRHRFREPLRLAWLVLGLFAIGRFFEFFLRGDSPDLALGLSNTQWTSVALLVICVAGARFVRPRDPA
ncbi:prolipoprotein diacylglyceryl transferase family protein [Patulibacter sp. NPDC049589]|uniref:prolipoprotein diacylglyceryl transferase n=1 Tax=Patulibacter sp. NPDC049589 TaxID=3154731 RepID=UPI00343B7828